MPGGGVALVRSIEALKNLEVSGDEATGVRILQKAMEEPLRLIAENSGHEGSVVLNLGLQQADDYVYEVDIGDEGPMVERGIGDPS